ncbi:WD repeat-containing protein 83 [Boothiomyces sp. JEL0866]|nr:WD repeat-containing protein 83 [Boothiomyces sp. JEL0866]
MFPRQKVGELKGHTGSVHSAIYSKDGEYVLSAGGDRSIKLWNPKTETCIFTYTGHGKEVLSVQLPLNENTRFASGSGDRSVFLWDVSTGKTVQRFHDHTQRVNAVDFNKEGQIIISGSYDATVRIWDCRSLSKRPVQTLSEAKDSVEWVKMEEYQILSGSVDGHVRVYDIRTRKVIIDNVGFPITYCGLSNDKNCMLVNTLDNVIRLFDVETGELLNDYRGHKNQEYRLVPCLTKNDSHVIGGSEDGKVRIWDLVEGEIVHTIDAHEQVVTMVHYHPFEHEMLTCSFDNTIKVWK